MNYPLFPWVTDAQQKSAARMMENLGISGLAKRHIRDLSGGQQQRIFLARALVGDRAILLLDEPTSGVDIKTRDDIMHLLHELNHQGITVIMTTHEINSVAAHLYGCVTVWNLIIKRNKLYVRMANRDSKTLSIITKMKKWKPVGSTMSYLTILCCVNFCFGTSR